MVRDPGSGFLGFEAFTHGQCLQLQSLGYDSGLRQGPGVRLHGLRVQRVRGWGFRHMSLLWGWIRELEGSYVTPSRRVTY